MHLPKRKAKKVAKKPTASDVNDTNNGILEEDAFVEQEGQKYDLAARKKTIKLVNHKWLEDCLRKWEIVPEKDYSKSGYELEMEMELEAPRSLSNTIASRGFNIGAGIPRSLYSCSLLMRFCQQLEMMPEALLRQDVSKFLKINPIGFVPALVDGDVVIADSFAILMYLEEKFPQHPLLPRDLEKRAINYQAANIVSASIQPLQNLGVLNYIEEKVGTDAKLPWAKKHIGKGFAALEKLLENTPQEMMFIWLMCF